MRAGRLLFSCGANDKGSECTALAWAMIKTTLQNLRYWLIISMLAAFYFTVVISVGLLIKVRSDRFKQREAKWQIRHPIRDMDRYSRREY